MEKRWVRFLLWLAVLAVCGMIFFFSAQSGDQSAQTSGKVVEWLIELLVRGYELLDAVRQREIYETASLLVRKLAHFGEFALLGFLVRLLLRSYHIRKGGAWAWFAATLYASTDELHQLFVDARGASLMDVGIDSLGAAIGVAFACLLLWRLGAKTRKSAYTGPQPADSVPTAE